MRLSIFACAFYAIAGLGIAETDSPTVAQVEALERYASNATARVTWSQEVAQIPSAEAKATITAVIVKDETQARREMRGVRIDFTHEGRQDRIYVPDNLLDRLIGALDEIAADRVGFLRRSTGDSRCFGSGAFLIAMRAGAHFFHGSQCIMTDGFAGLSVTTGRATFRFNGVTPLPFADALRQAALLLE